MTVSQERWTKSLERLGNALDRFMYWRIEIYRVAAVGGAQYSLIASDVQVATRWTSEVDVQMGPGRTKESNIFTLDNFFVKDECDIRDTDVVRLISPEDNSAADGWWYVQGNPQNADAGNWKMVYGKKGPAPVVI